MILFGRQERHVHWAKIKTSGDGHDWPTSRPRFSTSAGPGPGAFPPPPSAVSRALLTCNRHNANTRAAACSRITANLQLPNLGQGRIMAGRVRQPIDVRSLEAWISKTVPEIEVPLDVKQVDAELYHAGTETPYSQFSLLLVWLRTIQSDIPNNGRRRQEICPPQEAPRPTGLQDGAQGRT